MASNDSSDSSKALSSKEVSDAAKVAIAKITASAKCRVNPYSGEKEYFVQMHSGSSSSSGELLTQKKLERIIRTGTN